MRNETKQNEKINKFLIPSHILALLAGLLEGKTNTYFLSQLIVVRFLLCVCFFIIFFSSILLRE